MTDIDPLKTALEKIRIAIAELRAMRIVVPVSLHQAAAELEKSLSSLCD